MRPIPFYQSGEYVFHFRGIPNEEMSLELYAEAKSNDNRSELTNLDTELEASLECDASENKKRAPDDRHQSHWMLMSGPFAAYWHRNCVSVRLKPSDSYTLTLRIKNVDPKTPRINLIPTLKGGQLDL
jgi:hypothetical protein